MMRWWWQLVRFGFRLLYNELAWTYDLVSKIVSLGAWRCWQRAALGSLELPASGMILELAHGTGDLQADLQDAGYRTVGLDVSASMGRIARQKLLRQGRSPQLVRALAQYLPFPTESMAGVVSTFPTDFILAPDTLREVWRVLQPEAVWVIVPNGLLTGGGIARDVLEWLYRVTGQRGQESHSDALTALFRSAGFEATFAVVRCPRSVAQVIIARKRGYTNLAES